MLLPATIEGAIQVYIIIIRNDKHAFHLNFRTIRFFPQWLKIDACILSYIWPIFHAWFDSFEIKCPQACCCLIKIWYSKLLLSVSNLLKDLIQSKARHHLSEGSHSKGSLRPIVPRLPPITGFITWITLWIVNEISILLNERSK